MTRLAPPALAALLAGCAQGSLDCTDLSIGACKVGFARLATDTSATFTGPDGLGFTYSSNPQAAATERAFGAIDRALSLLSPLGRLQDSEPEPPPAEGEEFDPDPDQGEEFRRRSSYEVRPNLPRPQEPIPVVMGDGRIMCALSAEPLRIPLLVPDAQGRPGWVDVTGEGVSQWQAVSR